MSLTLNEARALLVPPTAGAAGERRVCECGRTFALAEGSQNVRCQRCIRYSMNQNQEPDYESIQERRGGSGPSNGWEGRL